MNDEIAREIAEELDRLGYISNTHLSQREPWRILDEVAALIVKRAVVQARQDRVDLQSQLERLRAENAQLRNALLPFALLDIRHLRERSDNEPIWAINKSQITNGHIRKAQQLIQEAVDKKL